MGHSAFPKTHISIFILNVTCKNSTLWSAASLPWYKRSAAVIFWLPSLYTASSSLCKPMFCFSFPPSVHFLFCAWVFALLNCHQNNWSNFTYLSSTELFENTANTTLHSRRISGEMWNSVSLKGISRFTASTFYNLRRNAKFSAVLRFIF